MDGLTSMTAFDLLRIAMVALDFLTHPVVRIALPAALALLTLALSKRGWLSVLVYAAANFGLDALWQWYVTPLNCMDARLLGLSDGYVIYWGVAMLAVLVIGALVVYYLKRIGDRLG